MSHRYQSLTQREREALRLILHGHDAKSMAGELGLSVHTVNEYLRNARRKLGVTSSKEAARCLFEEESDGPHFLGHKSLGDAGKGGAGQFHEPPPQEQSSGGAISRKSRVSIIGGLLIMSIILTALALALLPAPSNAPQDAAASLEMQESEIQANARQWLQLNDAGEWQAAYEGTAASFQSLNSAEEWAQASEQARPPLGAVLSRRLQSVEGTPTPEGYRIAKFATRFENRPDTATETITLVREGEEWKIAGIFIE